MAAAKVISRLGANAASPSEVAATGNADHEAGIRAYYLSKIDELELVVRERTQNLQRLKAQRNEWNAKGACVGMCGLGWDEFGVDWRELRPCVCITYVYIIADVCTRPKTHHVPPQCGCCARSCTTCRSRARTWGR